MRIISVYGVRYCDVILYLARTLQNMHYKVLVCDKSIAKQMRSFIPVFDEFDLDHDIFDYAGFGYTYSGGKADHGQSEMQQRMMYVAEEGFAHEAVKALKEAIEEDEDESLFDVMIILHDATAALADCRDDMADPDVKKNIRLFITDEYPENIFEMKSVLKAVQKHSVNGGEGLDGKKLFVVRDYTGTARLMIDELKLLSGASKSFLIPWSKKDRRLEMLAAYNDGFRFIGASDQLQNLIEELCSSIGIDTDDFEFQRAYMKAGKGKKI